jgi:prepilin-type processing-associated H-X9-DG protein
MSKGTNAALCATSPIPQAARGVFDVASTTRVNDITDGTSNTFGIGEAAGNNQRYLARYPYISNVPLLDPAVNTPQQIDQSWSAAMVVDGALFSSTHKAYGCVLGVTAQSGGIFDATGAALPVDDEPLNGVANSLPVPPGSFLVLASVDNNGGCDNNNPTPDTVSGFRSVHPGGCNFVFMDGSVHFVKANIDAPTYRALSTRAGGEVLTGDF